MCSPRRRRPMTGGGFPHSEIRGSGPDDGSPRLIAVFRVLLRLMPPRHPPRARMRLARYAFASLSLVALHPLSSSRLSLFKDRARRNGWLVGPTRVELVTSSLSGTRSNQLSYEPPGGGGRNRTGDVLLAKQALCQLSYAPRGAPGGEAERLGGKLGADAAASCATGSPRRVLLRKEVIQPLVPQRLPCYDFIPITTHTLDGPGARLRVQTAFMM